MSIRVRFAPSPTGYLHIGGARTALFNWLYARHHGGKFILRIEDTDESRNSNEAIQVIIDTMKWLGLDWDEGPGSADPAGPSEGDRGPYFQSQRGDIYKGYVEKLLDNGSAYEADGAIKFRMPKEPIIIPDQVVGDVERKLTDREEKDPDFVIVRSDGKPVFHLVNVVDDIEMGITHVIRGEDHLSNTSKHIKLFEALGHTPPVFGHIPLILNSDGSKMSKRDEGASMTTYMESGFVPEAVINFLALLGWSSKEEIDLLKVDDLIKRFDTSGILRSNARFDMAKLQWFNAEYIKALDPSKLAQGCLPFLKKENLAIEDYPSDYIERALNTCKEKIKTFSEMPDFSGFFFIKHLSFDPEIVSQQLHAKNLEVIEKIRAAFSDLRDFSVEAVQGAMKSVAVDLGIKPGKVMGATRLAVTGSKSGPGVTDLISILGKEQTLKNLDSAIDFINGSMNEEG